MTAPLLPPASPLRRARRRARLAWLRGLAVAAAGTAATVAAIAAEPTAIAADTPAAAPGAPAQLRVCADPANLPYSNDRGEGFENRIAEIVADELHARVAYAWSVQRRGFLRRSLNAQACDLVLDVPAGLEGVQSLAPLWTSSYVFVTRRDAAFLPRGLDDPALRTLRIGLQALGAEGANPPPAASLAARGLADRVVGFPMWGPADAGSPMADMVDAVAQGRIDTAIVWGPFAGWFARRYADRLEITPIASDPRLPGLAFTYAMAPGVRRGDDALAARVQAALAHRAGDIRAVLEAYGVPLVDGPPPTVVTAASGHTP
jgi:quinoprotein dehydrogenase-associated probable ABC transporter substrate-binding protein